MLSHIPRAVSHNQLGPSKTKTTRTLRSLSNQFLISMPRESASLAYFSAINDKPADPRHSDH
jgi:hypothetical protein